MVAYLSLLRHTGPATVDAAKEVHMATVKREEWDSGLTRNPPESAREAEPAPEPADYELDEKLRRLRLDEWFALAEEGMPLWAC
jgi:hypothetical protein